MNERIKELRKHFHLTQQEFADRLGIPRNNIAGYETGKRSPSEAAIALICRAFKVNEDWLRDGKGNMFIPEPESSIDFLCREYGLNKNDAILIERFVGLSPDQRNTIIEYMISVSKKLNE